MGRERNDGGTHHRLPSTALRQAALPAVDDVFDDVLDDADGVELVAFVESEDVLLGLLSFAPSLAVDASALSFVAAGFSRLSLR